MRKFASILISGLMAGVLLTGCGGTGSAGSAPAAANSPSETAEAPAAEAPADSTGNAAAEASDGDNAPQEASEESAGSETTNESVRLGSILALGTASPFVAKEKGYYSDAGFDVTLTEFSDGAAMMEAFAAGEIDIAFGGIIPAATWYSKGVDLKVVAGINGGGHVVMTRADSGINTVEDLKGKSLAAPSVGTVTDALLRDNILKNAGLNPETDLNVIPGMKPADMATSLMATKEVDAMITWEPFATRAIAEYGDEIKVLFDAGPELRQNETDPFYPVNVVIVTGDFINNHAEALDKFLRIHEDVTNYINENPEEADNTIGEILKIDASVVKGARDRTDFSTAIDQDAAMNVLGWAYDLGYLSELPDKAEFFYQK